MATLDQAQRCPMCQQTGEIRIDRFDAKSNGRLLTIYCKTVLCEWYDTPWNVSIREDGTIPDPTDHTKTEKEYFDMAHDDLEAQRVINYLTELDLESRKPHGPSV